MTKANPPTKDSGIYVIKIKERGKSIEEVIKDTESFIKSFEWENAGKNVEKKLLDNINRIKMINDCNIIYIGRAGTMENHRSLYGRYIDIWWTHPANYPVQSLMRGGWRFEYGWRKSVEPEKDETHYKDIYKERHSGLPALVKR